jgi:hypothetical protein
MALPQVGLVNGGQQFRAELFAQLHDLLRSTALTRDDITRVESRLRANRSNGGGFIRDHSWFFGFEFDTAEGGVALGNRIDLAALLFL